MHCELIVPGLFAQPARLRAPALELLLARGRRATGESASLENWLRQAFGIENAPLPAGALTVLAGPGDPGEACWARVDPVHLRLMRDRLIVVPSAAFPLSREDVDALVQAINQHFGEALALQAVSAEHWCTPLSEALAFDAGPPIEMAGRDADLAARIGGAAGKRWAALLTEVQMLLHSHPVNEAREARGEPPVNSLWLWGVGRAPVAASARWQSVTADDPVARGLARLAGARQRTLPDDGAAWLERSSEEGRHLLVLDHLRAPLALGHEAEYTERLGELDARWFAPLLAALRAGRIGMVTLRVPDRQGVAFETIRGDLRRFWRRPKALEKYA